MRKGWWLRTFLHCKARVGVTPAAGMAPVSSSHRPMVGLEQGQQCSVGCIKL